jgi:hypothetical protein
MNVGDQFHATVETSTGTNSIGGWVDPRTGVGAVEKKNGFCPELKSNPYISYKIFHQGLMVFQIFL